MGVLQEKATRTTRMSHDGHPDALSFEIDEEGEDTYFKSYAKSRGMLVIANLEWQAEKKK